MLQITQRLELHCNIKPFIWIAKKKMFFLINACDLSPLIDKNVKNFTLFF